jgi:carboxymethylenebutenolidase
MCFDHDSRPPIAPIEGGSLDAREIALESADGTRFMAYQARAAEPDGSGIVILPDVRGLHAYYRDLALRFAEHGVEAIAIDYFGRTAGIGDRGPGFDYQPHVAQTTYAGLTADVAAAVARLRETTDATRLFTVGFCFGGRIAFLSAGMGFALSGVIGFYGWPTGSARNDTPAPADVAGTFQAPVLGLFGGADQGINADVRGTFETALTAAGIDHKLVVYPNAPHSFFDRKADEFSSTSAQAWDEVLAFIRSAAVAPA